MIKRALGIWSQIAAIYSGLNSGPGSSFITTLAGVRIVTLSGDHLVTD